MRPPITSRMYVQGVGSGRIPAYGPMTRAAAAQCSSICSPTTAADTSPPPAPSLMFPPAAGTAPQSALWANADVIDGYPDGSFKARQSHQPCRVIKLIVCEMFGVGRERNRFLHRSQDHQLGISVHRHCHRQRLDHRLHRRQLQAHQQHPARRGRDLYEPRTVRTCDTSYVAAQPQLSKPSPM